MRTDTVWSSKGIQVPKKDSTHYEAEVSAIHAGYSECKNLRKVMRKQIWRVFAKDNVKILIRFYLYSIYLGMIANVWKTYNATSETH